MKKESTVETMELVEQVAENCEISENTGKKTFKKSIIGLGVFAAVAGTITAIVRKRKDKTDDWMVKRLEKKGYTIVAPLFDEDDVEVDEFKVD